MRRLNKGSLQLTFWASGFKIPTLEFPNSNFTLVSQPLYLCPIRADRYWQNSCHCWSAFFNDSTVRTVHRYNDHWMVTMMFPGPHCWVHFTVDWWLESLALAVPPWLRGSVTMTDPGTWQPHASHRSLGEDRTVSSGHWGWLPAVKTCGTLIC